MSQAPFHVTPMHVLIVVSSLVLGWRILATSVRCRDLGVSLAVATVPALLGITAMAIEYRDAYQEMAAAGGNASPASLAAGFGRAFEILALGLGATTLLVLVACCAWWFGTHRREGGAGFEPIIRE